MNMACRSLALLSIVCAAGLIAAAGCASKPRSIDLNLPVPSDEELRRATALAADGQVAMTNKEFTRAIDLFSQSLAIRSDNGGVWNNLGLALKARGKDLDYVQAADAFKRAADLLPADERPYQNLGILYHERGFSDEALRYFNFALERNPNSIESLRGSISSAKLLLRSDESGLTRVNRALMIDSDPAWRKIEEFERLRIQHDLADRYASPTR